MNYKIKNILFLILTMILLLITSFTYKNDYKNYTILFLSLSIILLIYLLYIFFIKKDNKSIYKRNIKKIKKIYNSQLKIVEDSYEFENENFVNAKNLEDLFELSEEFKQPIVYIEEEGASIYLLQYGEDILYYILKEEEKKESEFEKEIKRIKERKNKQKESEKEILSKINKTTIIQLKNNKFYKIKPIKK